MVIESLDLRKLFQHRLGEHLCPTGLVWDKSFYSVFAKCILS